MNGERIFRAIHKNAGKVTELMMGWNKRDTGAVMLALSTGSYKALPRQLRDFFEAVAKELQAY